MLLFTVNQNPATGGDCLRRWKDLLVTAGWTVPKSGSGTAGTFGSSDLITTAAIAGTTGHWFVVQMPLANGVNRQWCYQRNTTSTGANWRIKYSYSAGFVGGSPSATQTPSASDEVLLLGGGTDASPTFTALFNNTDGFARFHCAADNAAPYGTYAFATSAATGQAAVTTMALLFDPMAVNSYPSGDADPYVFLHGAGSTWQDSNYGQTPSDAYLASTNGNKCSTYWKKGLTGEAFLNCAAVRLFLGSSTAFIQNLPVNHITGKDDRVTILYGRHGSVTNQPSGLKGYSSMASWSLTPRNTIDTFTLVTASDRIVVDDIELPWNGSVPIL